MKPSRSTLRIAGVIAVGLGVGAAFHSLALPLGAAGVPVPADDKPDIVVIAPSMYLSRDLSQAYTVILDRKTSKLWAYADLNKPPRLLGIFKPGEPLRPAGDR